MDRIFEETVSCHIEYQPYLRPEHSLYIPILFPICYLSPITWQLRIIRPEIYQVYEEINIVSIVDFDLVLSEARW